MFYNIFCGFREAKLIFVPNIANHRRFDIAKKKAISSLETNGMDIDPLHKTKCVATQTWKLYLLLKKTSNLFKPTISHGSFKTKPKSLRKSTNYIDNMGVWALSRFWIPRVEMAFEFTHGRAHFKVNNQVIDVVQEFDITSNNPKLFPGNNYPHFLAFSECSIITVFFVNSFPIYFWNILWEPVARNKKKKTNFQKKCLRKPTFFREIIDNFFEPN